MHVGYLHLGPAGHGVTRHGRALAAAAAHRPDLTVREESLVLGADPTADRDALVAAATHLGTADVVHVQCSTFNELLWGPGAAAAANLRAFFDACAAPVIVTLHDVWLPRRGVRGALGTALPQALAVARGRGAPPADGAPARARAALASARGWWTDAHGHGAAVVDLLRDRAACVVVATRTEAERLGERVAPERIRVIPLPVEHRTPRRTREDARAALGVQDARVLTSLGFVFPYKGNGLVVEALAQLPDDVVFVMAGRDDVDPAHTAALVARAAELGVAHRVRRTGHLRDDELEDWLVATDLAVCAFADLSASASLATWVSVTCPVLASDLPQVRELDALAPGAIATFRPYTADALAEAARAALDADPAPARARLAALRERVSPAQTIAHHVDVYGRR